MSGLGRFIGIVALFSVVGPPIGAIAFGVVGAAGAWLIDAPPGTAAMILGGGMFGIFFSWFIGGLQAAVAGAAMAGFAALTGRLSVIVAMAAGLLAGLPRIYEEWDSAPYAALLAVVHLAPACACGLIAKAIWAPLPVVNPPGPAGQ
jgi:hypothetical protein